MDTLNLVINISGIPANIEEAILIAQISGSSSGNEILKSIVDHLEKRDILIESMSASTKFQEIGNKKIATSNTVNVNLTA